MGRRAGWEAELDVLARAKVARRHEKALARRERVLLRARRAVPLHGTAAAMSTVLLLLSEGADGLWGTAAVVTAVVAGRALVTLRHPPPVPALPAAPVPGPPSPPAGSAAEPAVRRLDRVRTQLDRLGPLVGPSGRAAADDALLAAAEAETALRWQAARLAAVEEHRGVDPLLLGALLDGVATQERLVAGLADLVAASDPHVPGASASLQDAADALHGLAHGLRQVR